MKTKFFTLLSLSVLALVMMVSLVSASVLSEWALTSDGTATSVANINTGTLVGNNVNIIDYNSSTGANVDGWPTASTVDTTNYLEVTLTASGSNFIIDSISFNHVSDDSTTIMNFDVDWSKDGFATPINLVNTATSTTTSASSSTNTEILLEDGDTLTLRILGYGADAVAEIFSIKNLVFNGEVIPDEINTCYVTGNTAGEDNNELQLSIEDVTITGFGDADENEWFAFDEVEIEIEVENDHKEYKIEDITIEWGLYDLETEEWYVNDEINDFNLKDGDKETKFITFDLKEDIDEFVDGDYVFYVWVNAKLDDGTDKELCASVSEEVTIMDENDFVILDNIQMVETTTCGTSVELTADIWNIGSEDQEGVYIRIESEELGITQQVEIGEIEAYEDEEISVLLNIPQDAEEKSYTITFVVFDEYEDVFENSNDDIAEFEIELMVEGNCINEPKVDVSADLESEAKAGRELIIKTTVVNTGTETSTFELSASDYILWASFGSISSESVTLEAGESAEVMITLNVNSDISGNQNFEIVVTEGTKVLAQPVSVMIEEQSGFAGITGGLISEGNWPIWTIGAINVVLVFVIILVALKVAKKQ